MKQELGIRHYQSDIYSCETMNPVSPSVFPESLFVQKTSDVMVLSQLINCNEAEGSRGRESYLAERPVLLCFLFTVPRLCRA